MKKGTTPFPATESLVSRSLKTGFCLLDLIPAV